MASQKKDILGHYNTIIFDRDTKTIFVPAYLRLVAKSIKSLKLESLQSEINSTIILNIFTFGLPDHIQKEISRNMTLQFNRDDILKLPPPQEADAYQVDEKLYGQICKELLLETYLLPDLQQNHKIEQQKRHNELQKQGSLPTKVEQKVIKQSSSKKAQKNKSKEKVKIGYKWTKRTTRKAFVEPYIFFTPFQVMDLVLSIRLRKIHVGDFTVRFNIMDTQTLAKKISFTENTQFGYYNMATKRLHVEYTTRPTHQTLMSLDKNFYNFSFLDNYRQEVQQDTQKLHINDKLTSISNAHFHLPIFKNPVTVVTTLFIPLWLLSSINLAIFSQSPSLGDRIGSIATLMIAFVGLIPITRQQIPINPTITIFQILVYLQVFTELLCLWQSMQHRTQDEDKIQIFIQTYNALYDPYFLIALFVSLVIFILPFGMCLYHFFVLKDKHFGPSKNVQNDKKFTKWNISEEANEIFADPDNNKKQNLILLHEKGFLESIKIVQR